MFRRRFFVLKGYMLYYFERRDSRDAKGSIDLSVVGAGYVRAGVDLSGGRKAPPTPHCLTLAVPGRDFAMCFATEAEVGIWLTWLQEVADLLFGTDPLTRPLPAAGDAWPRCDRCVRRHPP